MNLLFCLLQNGDYNEMFHFANEFEKYAEKFNKPNYSLIIDNYKCEAYLRTNEIQNAAAQNDATGAASPSPRDPKGNETNYQQAAKPHERWDRGVGVVGLTHHHIYRAKTDHQSNGNKNGKKVEPPSGAAFGFIIGKNRKINNRFVC